ncbi:MAG: Rrf2 family transcriptional regulator [Myxococcota bacterium]
MRLLGLPSVAQYALRAMTCVAAADAAAGALGFVPADVLAARTAVPPAFLSKVLRKLVRGGLLRSTKGHHGGFTLARAPATIRLLDVLEAVEVELTSNTCAFGWGRCDSHTPCPLHAAHLELRHSLLEWATHRTLADIDLSLCDAPPEASGAIR